MGIHFPRVVLIGAGGSLGSQILNRLLQEPEIEKITILSRTSSSSTFPSSPKVNIIKIDDYTTDETALIAAFTGHDIVISAVNSFESNLDLWFLSAAIKAGVERFLPSEYSLDVTHPKWRAIANFPPANAKLEVVEQVEKAAERGEIEYTTIVPGGFLDWALDVEFIGINIPGRKITLFDGGVHIATGSTLDFIARSIVAVLKMPKNETRNKRIRIAEASYTGQELLNILEDVIGEKFEVTSVPTASLVETATGVELAIGQVLRMNFNGSGVSDLRDGLEWNASGEFAITRKGLEQIVREAVERSRK